VLNALIAIVREVDNYVVNDFYIMVLLQFDSVNNISLAEISKTTDENGSNPILCITKQMQVTFHEKYKNDKLFTGIYTFTYVSVCG